MKRLPSRSRAYIRLNIEQMLFQAEFSERPLHDAVMPGPHFDSMVGNSGYQYSQQLHPESLSITFQVNRDFRNKHKFKS